MVSCWRLAWRTAHNNTDILCNGTRLPPSIAFIFPSPSSFSPFVLHRLHFTLLHNQHPSQIDLLNFCLGHCISKFWPGLATVLCMKQILCFIINCIFCYLYFINCCGLCFVFSMFYGKCLYHILAVWSTWLFIM